MTRTQEETEAEHIMANFRKDFQETKKYLKEQA